VAGANARAEVAEKRIVAAASFMVSSALESNNDGGFTTTLSKNEEFISSGLEGTENIELYLASTIERDRCTYWY
jgi:hypothetical protein